MGNLADPEKVLSEVEPSPYPWFALRVRSNYEKISGSHLRERGYEQFSPSYWVERRWSDRTKQIERFLFPGYIFCRFDPNDRFPVVTVPGIVDVVGFGKSPEQIPDAEIERVRRMVESGAAVSPYPYMRVGQTVRIEQGPLTGVEGVLVQVKGKTRLVVSVNLLQRSVSAEIDRHSIRPVSTSSSETVRCN
jgi:transcription antitermination factor NusG